jgi:hypothetical protein
MRRSAEIISSSILLIGSGYALSMGALPIALPSIILALLLLLPSMVPGPALDVHAGRGVADARSASALQTEIARSRRHNRSFAVVRLPWAAPPSAGVPLVSLSTNRQVATLRAQVRFVDHVWSEPDGLYILMPESEIEQVRMFLARLETGLGPEAIDARTAIFPKDGPTEEAIRKRLRENDRASLEAGPRLTDWSDELVGPQSPPVG